MGEYADNKQTNRTWLNVENLLQVDSKTGSQIVTIPYDSRYAFMEDPTASGSVRIVFNINEWGSYDYFKLIGNYQKDTQKGWYIGVGRPNSGALANQIYYVNSNGSPYKLVSYTSPHKTGYLCDVIVIKAGLTISIYVGGILLTNQIRNEGSLSATYSTTQPIQVASVGQYEDFVYNDCITQVSFISFYNKTLTQADELELYNEIGLVPKSLHPNCVGFLPMQEKSGSKLYDAVEQFNYAKEIINFRNPTFTGTSTEANEWVIGFGGVWNFSGGVATSPENNNSFALYQTNVPMLIGHSYRISFEIVSIIGIGSFKTSLGYNTGTGTFNDSPPFTSAGIYSAILTTPPNSNNVVYFRSDDQIQVSFKNVKIEAVSHGALKPNHADLIGYYVPVIKTNLFTDPCFNVGISGWSWWTESVVSWNSLAYTLALSSNVSDGFCGISYGFTTVIGKEYIFKATITGTGASSATWKTMKSDQALVQSNIVTGNAVGSNGSTGISELKFTATSTTSYVWVFYGNSVAGNSCTVDNVEFGETIYEVSADARVDYYTKKTYNPNLVITLPQATSYFRVAPPANLPIGKSARTLMFWLKKPTNTADAFMSYGNIGSRIFEILLVGNNIYVHFVGYETPPQPIPNIDKLQHFAITVTPSGAAAGIFRYYLMGALIWTSAEVPLDTISSDIKIGTGEYSYRDGGTQFNDIRLWDHVLTLSEIFTEIQSDVLVKTSGIVGAWSVTSTTCIDTSGKGNNGILIGTGLQTVERKSGLPELKGAFRTKGEYMGKFGYTSAEIQETTVPVFDASKGFSIVATFIWYGEYCMPVSSLLKLEIGGDGSITFDPHGASGPQYWGASKKISPNNIVTVIFTAAINGYRSIYLNGVLVSPFDPVRTFMNPFLNSWVLSGISGSNNTSNVSLISHGTWERELTQREVLKLTGIVNPSQAIQNGMYHWMNFNQFSIINSRGGIRSIAGRAKNLNWEIYRITTDEMNPAHVDYAIEPIEDLRFDLPPVSGYSIYMNGERVSINSNGTANQWISTGIPRVVAELEEGMGDPPVVFNSLNGRTTINCLTSRAFKIPIPVNQGDTVFYLGRRQGSNDVVRFYHGLEGGAGNYQTLVTYQGQFDTSAGSSDNFIGASHNNWFLSTIVYNGSNSSWSFNNGAITTFYAGDNNVNGYTLTGQVETFLVYPRVLTLAEQQAVNNFLMKRTGLI